MKKITLFSMVLLAVFLAPTIANAAECWTSDDLYAEKVETRNAFSDYRTERHLIGMETVLDYLNEQDANTELIEKIKNNFENRIADFETAETTQDYNSIVSDLKEFAKDFKDKSQTLATNLDEVRTRVKQALEENDDQLDEMRDTAYQKADQHQLRKFDESICRLEKEKARVIDLGYDTENIDDDLEEYRQLKNNLNENIENTRNACGEIPIVTCEEDEKEEYNEFLETVGEQFLKTRTHMGIVVSKQLFEKTEDQIQRLESLGADVSDFEETLEDIQDDWKEQVENDFADEKYNLGSDLRRFRERVQDLREDMRDEWKDLRSKQLSEKPGPGGAL